MIILKIFKSENFYNSEHARIEQLNRNVPWRLVISQLVKTLN